MNLSKSVIICGSQYFIDKNTVNHVYDDIYEVHSFFADELDMESLQNIIFTRSLFYEGKTVVINKIDLLKKNDELISAVQKSSYTFFVFTTGNEKKAVALKKALPDFELISEGKVTARDNVAEIIRIFKEKEVAIDSATASQILQIVPDMNNVEIWAEKFMLYYHGRKNAPKELLQFISGEPEEKVFGFLENYMARRKNACIQSYAAISDIKNSSIQIISMLTSYIAALFFKLTAKQLASSENPFFKGSMYFMRSVDANISKWKVSEVEQVIEKLAEMDLHIKTGRISAADALLVLVKFL